jgi:hypothetical protein
MLQRPLEKRDEMTLKHRSYGNSHNIPYDTEIRIKASCETHQMSRS